MPGGTGPSSLFVGGGAGCLSHCLQVVVVCPHHAICGWWWCTLIGFHAAWCVALVTVVVVLSSLKGEGGGSFVSVDAPSVIILCWHPVLFLCAVIACPCSCVHSSLSCVPRCRVSSLCHCPVMLLLPCPHCDMLFDCHITVSDMAPVLKR